MKIKDEYDALRKKYKQLPSFEKLDAEFEIRGIDENTFLVREIRKNIMERLEYYANYLNELLQPEATMANLRESQDFTPKEKEDMYELYKRLMIAHRAGMEVGITNGEGAHVGYIVEICKDWDKVKTQMLAILKKVKQSWLKDTRVDTDVSYFG